MLSKESKRVAIAPFLGLGCHPRVGRRQPEVIRDPGVKAALGPVSVCVWRGCSVLWVPLP